jgi:hypothetical protein
MGTDVAPKSPPHSAVANVSSIMVRSDQADHRGAKIITLVGKFGGDDFSRVRERKIKKALSLGIALFYSAIKEEE